MTLNTVCTLCPYHIQKQQRLLHHHCQSTKPKADQTAVNETARTVEAEREWTPKRMTVFIEEENRNLWTQCFVVVDESGTLMVFEDETMRTMKTSFILGALTLNNFTFNGPKPHFPLFRLHFEAQGQSLQFLFETAAEHREFVEFMTRYIDCAEDEGICSLSLFLTAPEME